MTPRSRTWTAAALFVVALSGVALGLGDRALVVIHTVQSVAAGRPAEPLYCSFKRSTGIPCVGCGGTRAFEMGARGHLVAAARQNVLGAYAALTAWCLLAASLFTLASGRTAPLRVLLVTVGGLSPLVLLIALLGWFSRLPPGALIGRS